MFSDLSLTIFRVNLMRTNVLAAARNVLKNIPSYWNNKLIFPDVQIDA